MVGDLAVHDGDAADYTRGADADADAAGTVMMFGDALESGEHGLVHRLAQLAACCSILELALYLYQDCSGLWKLDSIVDLGRLEFQEDHSRSQNLTTRQTNTHGT